MKTFIKESYDNGMALRHAEQSSEGDRRASIVHSPYMDRSTVQPDRVDRSNDSRLPLTRSSSSTSNASNSEDEDEESSIDDLDEDDDQNETISRNSNIQNELDRTDAKRDASRPKALSSRVPYQSRLSYHASSNPDIHRESNILLQMIPYRPTDSHPILSDRLISGTHGPDMSDTPSATRGVSTSVRLLLDKWTISGSATISDVLEEEAAREKDEASVRAIPSPKPC